MSKRRRRTTPGMTRQGVRDLDAPHWYVAPSPPPPPTDLSAGLGLETPVDDLLYCPLCEVRQEILEACPTAKLEAVYDEIHGERTTVAIDNCARIDWYRFLVRSGIARVSFCFEVSIRLELPLIEVVLDAEVPGWRERCGKETNRVMPKEGR